jgi:hypothetical protein
MKTTPNSTERLPASVCSPLSVPDCSGWWWFRTKSDPDPVCVEVSLSFREDGTLRGGWVSYGKSVQDLKLWCERGESPEWVEAPNPWANVSDQATARGGRC